MPVIRLGPWILLLMLLWLPMQVAVAQSPFDLRYEVFRNGKAQGQAQLSLSELGPDRWRLRMVVEADRGLAGLIGFREEESSELRLGEGGEWQVLAYRRQRDAGFRKRSERIDFDWEAGRALIVEDGEQQVLPLQPGLADQNSVVLRMAADLIAQRSPGPYQVLRRGRIDQWQFRQLPAEQIGGRQVVLIERVREHNRRRTLSWLAPELGYMPVRMEQIEDGETLRLELVEGPGTL